MVLLKDGACMSVSSSLDDSLIHVGRLLRNFITTSCLWFIFFVSSTKMCVAEPMYFFSAGVAGSAGEGISSNSIKEFIKEIVDKEDQKSPYSDQDMAEMLQEKGIKISRRTVAKYRDEMHILSSSKRKRY